MAETDPIKYFEAEVKRLNYYNSQFLKEEDFSDEQLYHRQMRHYHNRSLHTWGIVSGLEVRQVEGLRKVTVTRGTAIDRLGQEIVLPQDTSVPKDNALPEEGETLSFDGFSANSQVYLTIKYREVFDQADKDTNSKNKLYTRATERPLLGLSATAPAADAPEVVLATIALGTDKAITQVDPGLRRYAGSRIGSSADGKEFGIYADSQGAWHFFDGSKGADRLTVDARGNVGINTNAPAVRLSVGGAGADVYSTDLWVERNAHVQGNEPLAQGGKGRLRVGSVWGYGGLYADNSSTGTANDLVLGSASGVVRVGPGSAAAQSLIVPNGNLAVGRDKAGAPLDVKGGVRAGSLTITDTDGTPFPDNWIGMASNIDGTTKWLHVGGITDAGARRLILAASRIYASGSVGVGTPTPLSLLHLREDVAGALGPILTLMNGGGGTGAGVAIDFDGYNPSTGAPSARIQSIDDGSFSSSLLFLSKAPGANTNALQERMRIGSDGGVGIGTKSPSGRLNISEAAGTKHGPSAGTLVIDHEDSGGVSSIVFRSKVNRGSDYGFIQYQDTDKPGGTGESARLIIGTSNDTDDHLILQPSGFVGVGVNDPSFMLDVYGRSRIRQGAEGNTAGHWLYNEGADRAFIGMANNNQVGLWGSNGIGWGLLMDCKTGHITLPGNLGTRGYPATAKKSTWGGGIHTWDIEAEGTIWSKNGLDTSAHDVAENYLSDMDLAPGDVVCLDRRENKIVLSEGPNDPMLMGVISTQPGLRLDANHLDEPRPGGMLDYPVALCGRVPCKVTDENGPIRRGDLLTSSSTRGHAMKARPVTVEGLDFYHPGTIIGKALEPHESGRGVVEIFVTLR